jgi:hypothetical protein
MVDIEALARSLAALAPEARLVRYRELAADALNQAKSCKDQTARRDYFRIATAWHALAVDLERRLADR